MCWGVERGRDVLIQPFLDFYQHLLQHNTLPLLYGALAAMGEAHFPLNKDQVKVVSSGLDGIIGNIVRHAEYKDISGYAHLRKEGVCLIYIFYRDTKPMLVMELKVMEQLTR